MHFADIHMHALWGVDDGVKTEAEMLAVLDAAYADGIRCICLTPHWHPGYFGDNREKTQERFASLLKIASGRYPGMQLYLGNELRYSRDCRAWLESGLCRCLGNTNYLLVDFYETESGKNIVHGLNRLLSIGYIPILAHAERYRKLSGSLKELRQCRRNGVLVQVDTQSLFGKFGFRAWWIAKKLLRERMVDFVASDAHDCSGRPPEMSRAYRWIAEKYHEDYANAVCCSNALWLLQGDFMREDV